MVLDSSLLFSIMLRKGTELLWLGIELQMPEAIEKEGKYSPCSMESMSHRNSGDRYLLSLQK